MSGFSALEVEAKTFQVFLTHPLTGVDLIDRETGAQAFIEVHGYMSDRGEPWRKKARVEAAKQGKGPRTKAEQEDEDKLRAQNADMLSSLTESWLLVDFDGNKIEDECNRANARDLFGNAKLAWLTRQVLEALAEEANFMAA